MGRWGRALLLLAAVVVVVGAVTALSRARDEPSADGAEQAPTTATPTPASPAPTRDPGPPLLLPNVRSLSASDVRVEPVQGGRELRFAASLANLGPGPLLLQPRSAGGGCPARQHPAVQFVYRDQADDGVYRPDRDRPLLRRPVGCMIEHPGHDHWHFDAMASYALRDPATGEVLDRRRKVSFCLRDNTRVAGVATRVRREHFGECTRTRHQGISPGWVDVYSADLPGQSLRLPPGAGRRLLCLDLSADPLGRIREVDETDNAVTVGVLVEGFDARLRPAADCG